MVKRPTKKQHNLDRETYTITIYCTRENQFAGTNVPAAVK